MTPGKFNALNDDNYPSWCQYMQARLITKELWGITSSADMRPAGLDNHKVVRAWQRKCDLAAAEILLNVSPKYASNCTAGDPVGTWEHLELLFHAEGQTTVAALCRQFHSMAKSPEESMRDWITRVEELTQHIKSLKSLLEDVDIINTLTHGIGDEYTPLVVQLESLPIDPDDPTCIMVSYVIRRLIGKEVWHTADASNTLAYYAAPHPITSDKAIGQARKCFNCGEEGHVQNECDVTPREVYNRKLKEKANKDRPSPKAKVAEEVSEEYVSLANIVTF